MSPKSRKIFFGMVALGLMARTVVGFETYGVPYDTRSFEAVRDALSGSALDLYSQVNEGPFRRWPYPPGFLPWIVVADWLAGSTGLPFHGWVHLPQIAADGALAWLVQHYLGLRGQSERLRLTAAALVLLGPSFAVVSGYHGQIDQLAILPAAAALVVWERSAPGLRRAVLVGLLIGLGASIKTTPALMLFAVLPSTETSKERGVLFGAAAAVPLVMLVPFLVADPGATVESLLDHRALAGLGGISLLAQPELVKTWLLGQDIPLSSVSQTLLDLQSPITALLLAPFIAILVKRRSPAVTSAAALWLVFFVVTPGFTFQYVVWALPFALMAGYVWQVAVIQAFLFLPSLMVYRRGIIDSPHFIYTPIMALLWLALLSALVWMLVDRRGPMSIRRPA